MELKSFRRASLFNRHIRTSLIVTNLFKKFDKYIQQKKNNTKHTTTIVEGT